MTSIRKRIASWLINHPKIHRFYFKPTFDRMIISISANNIEYLKNEGWKNSFDTKRGLDKNNFPIPWFSYSIIEFLEQRLENNLKVFEFGAGNSSIWWSQYAEEVISCEHDKEWINELRTVPKNVKIIHQSLQNDYTEFIKNYKKYFHIIVIDGRKRNECMKNSTDSLLPEGIIIVDDTQRQWYEKGCNFLTHQGFKRINFSGLGPVSPRKKITSVFYKENNILRI
jgi:hypothetical protein